MTSVFPHLFGFEHVGILFKCEKTNTLYSINCEEDLDFTKLKEDNIVNLQNSLI